MAKGILQVTFVLGFERLRKSNSYVLSLGSNLNQKKQAKLYFGKGIKGYQFHCILLKLGVEATGWPMNSQVYGVCFVRSRS